MAFLQYLHMLERLVTSLLQLDYQSHVGVQFCGDRSTSTPQVL